MRNRLLSIILSATMALFFIAPAVFAGRDEGFWPPGPIVVKPDGSGGGIIDGNLAIGAKVVMTTESTLPADDTTPSVSGDSNWVTANIGPTTITKLDDLTAFEFGFIRINDSNTTFDCTSSNIIGNGGADYAASSGEIIAYYSPDGTNAYISIGKPNAGGGDSDAIHDNVTGEISAIAEKATLADADVFLLEDSAASNGKKKVSATQLWANYLKAKADALYLAAETLSTGSGEINGLSEKASPVGTDLLVIEDSEDSNNKKKVQITNLPTGSDAAAIHDDTTGEIHAIAEKASPVSADEIIIEDSEASYAKKRVQIGNLPGGTGTDSAAIHDDTAGEINAISQEGSALEGTDQLIGEDAQNGNAKIKILLSEILTYITSNITSMDISYDVSTASGHPLNSDDSYSGMPHVGFNGGEAIAQWEVVYYDTTATEMLLADADASGKWPCFGAATAASTDGNPISVLQRGYIRNDAWDWTPGAVLYLSDTPGALTETASATATDGVQPIARAITADIIWFDADGINGYYRVGS